tara:strand:+ start:100 stop:474 length:375 start_codon:yes stop_codon:yes gene_type:complete
MAYQVFSQSFELNSPDGRIQIQVNNDDKISWSASLDGNAIIEQAVMGMDFSASTDFGSNPQIKKNSVKEVSSVIHPIVPHKDAKIKDEYVQLSLTFKGRYRLGSQGIKAGSFVPWRGRVQNGSV